LNFNKKNIGYYNNLIVQRLLLTSNSTALLEVDMPMLPYVPIVLFFRGCNATGAEGKFCLGGKADLVGIGGCAALPKPLLAPLVDGIVTMLNSASYSSSSSVAALPLLRLLAGIEFVGRGKDAERDF
jgi:hypothetical protein